jgi:hypothetical protein
MGKIFRAMATLSYTWGNFFLTMMIRLFFIKLHFFCYLSA